MSYFRRYIRVPLVVFLVHMACIVAAIFAIGFTSDSYLHLTNTPFDHLLQWDSQWYTEIGRAGYDIPKQDQAAFAITVNNLPLAPLQATAYFPLVPLLVHLFGAIGAVCLGNLAFFASVIVLYRLFSNVMTEKQAIWAITLYALNPTMVYQSALYTEVYMVLFSALVIYGIGKGGALGKTIASVSAVGAGFTHEYGLFLAVFVLRYVRLKDYKMACTYLLSTGSGWIIYGIYLFVKYGKILPMFAAEKAWERGWAFPGWNWVKGWHHLSVDLITVPLVLMLIVVYLYESAQRHRGTEQSLTVFSSETSLWVFCVTLVSLSTFDRLSPLISVTRLLCVAWPMFGSVWKLNRLSRLGVPIFTAMSVFIGILGTTVFTHGYFFE